MWKNIVEPDRSQMTIWRMRIACWIPKATNTHSDYIINICCICTVTIVARAVLIAMLYVHCYVICTLSVLFKLPVLTLQ